MAYQFTTPKAGPFRPECLIVSREVAEDFGIEPGPQHPIIPPAPRHDFTPKRVLIDQDVAEQIVPGITRHATS